jgi:hypothetical protein
LLPSTASIDVVSVFVPVAIVVVVVGGEGAIVVIVGTTIVPVVSVALAGNVVFSDVVRS